MHSFVVWVDLFVVIAHQSLSSQKNLKALTEHGEQSSLQKQDRKNILASLQDHAKCNYKQILWLYNHFVSNSTLKLISTNPGWAHFHCKDLNQLWWSLNTNHIYISPYYVIIFVLVLQAWRAPQWETEQKNLLVFCLLNLFVLHYNMTVW